MSGWNSFVDGTLRPIYNGGQDIKNEIVGDVGGIYEWGKGTVGKLGNLADHTIDNATKTEDALAKAMAALADMLSTPYLLYGGVAVVAILLLKK